MYLLHTGSKPLLPELKGKLIDDGYQIDWLPILMADYFLKQPLQIPNNAGIIATSNHALKILNDQNAKHKIYRFPTGQGLFKQLKGNTVSCLTFTEMVEKALKAHNMVYYMCGERIRKNNAKLMNEKGIVPYPCYRMNPIMGNIDHLQKNIDDAKEISISVSSEQVIELLAKEIPCVFERTKLMVKSDYLLNYLLEFAKVPKEKLSILPWP